MDPASGSPTASTALHFCACAASAWKSLRAPQSSRMASVDPDLSYPLTSRARPTTWVSDWSVWPIVCGRMVACHFHGTVMEDCGLCLELVLSLALSPSLSLYISLPLSHCLSLPAATYISAKELRQILQPSDGCSSADNLLQHHEGPGTRPPDLLFPHSRSVRDKCWLSDVADYWTACQAAVDN